MMRRLAILAFCLGAVPAMLMAEEPTPASIVPEASPPAEAPSAARRVPVQVTESTLEAPSPDSLGLPSGAVGGDVWKDSAYARLAALAGRLRLDAPSPAMHALALNLFSAPAAPADAAPAGSWLLVRLQQLLMLGEEKALKDIIQVIPASSGQKEIGERALTEQELLQGLTDKACERITGNSGVYNNSYWSRAALLCLAHAKKGEELDLALKVLSEQGETVALEDSLRKIAGEEGVKVPALKMAIMAPAEAAIAVEAGMLLDNGADSASIAVTPALARFYAVQSKWPLKIRTVMAERAFRAGAMPVEQLAGFYTQFGLKQAQADAFLKEKKLPESRSEAHALVYQLLEKEQKPEAVRDIVLAALPEFKKTGMPDLLYRMAAPKVKALALPSKLEGAWADFAPLAVAILAAAEEDQAALAWWQAMALMPEKPEGFETIRPLAGVLFQDAALSPAMMEAWLAKAPKPYAQTAAAVYVGLGGKIGPAFYDALDLQEEVPYMPFALSQLLHDAAAGHRKGETLLLGLLALGEKGTFASNMTLFKVLKEYQAAELSKEAKLLAREALIHTLP